VLATLAAVTSALGGPMSALAATPPRPEGVPVVEPEVSILSQVLAIAWPLAAIAVVLVVAFALAVVVARIGGRDVAPGPEPIPDASPPRRSPNAFIPALVAIAAVVAGVVTGREIAYERSMPGLAGALGGIIPMFLLIVAVAGLSLVGIIATVIRRGHVSRAIRAMLVTAGLLVIGAFGGAATAAATGAVHHEPVVLQAMGEASLRLDGVALPFAAPDRGRVECRSAPDETTVIEITTSEIGELGSGTILAAVLLPTETPRAATVRFSIDAADLPDGAVQPLWKGSALILELRADGTKGRLAFDGLSLHVEDKMPAANASWPAAISGELTWSCAGW
jgi:hypothetical protein